MLVAGAWSSPTLSIVGAAGAPDRTEAVFIWLTKAQGEFGCRPCWILTPGMPIISSQRMQPALINAA